MSKMIGAHPHVAGGFAQGKREPGVGSRAVARMDQERAKEGRILGVELLKLGFDVPRFKTRRILIDKKTGEVSEAPPAVRTCRKCGCTQDDCSQCVAKTGAPCHWVGEDKCSACFGEDGVELPAALEEKE